MIPIIEPRILITMNKTYKTEWINFPKGGVPRYGLVTLIHMKDGNILLAALRPTKDGISEEFVTYPTGKVIDNKNIDMWMWLPPLPADEKEQKGKDLFGLYKKGWKLKDYEREYL